MNLVDNLSAVNEFITMCIARAKEKHVIISGGKLNDRYHKGLRSHGVDFDNDNVVLVTIVEDNWIGNEYTVELDKFELSMNQTDWNNYLNEERKAYIAKQAVIELNIEATKKEIRRQKYEVLKREFASEK